MAAWITKRDRPKPWLARFAPPGGRTVSKAFYLKREAQVWLSAKRAEYEAGDFVDPRAGADTFGAYAAGWLERREVKPSTKYRDGSYIHSLMLPTFGERPLNAITPDEIEGWLVEVKSEKAPATVHMARRIIGAVFTDAVDRGQLARSPMPSKARLKRVLPKYPKPSNPNTKFLTIKEVGGLADAIEPMYRAMVLTGAYAGLRWGEVAALSPKSVDVGKRLLSVHSNLAQPVGGEPFRDNVMKTDAARRTIALGALTEVLVDHAEKYAANGWLFPTKAGGPLRAGLWRRRYWLPACEAVGLAPLRFHDLRHTHAALLIEQGEPVKLIQERLGHATATVTMSVYSHLFPGVDEAAADRLTGNLL
ncbi:MAG: site-specific integrase [Acidobacteria bacterium]|nr:site-specific integrase [Acidobacteriota bacterium]